jgi:hypothetical protein
MLKAVSSITNAIGALNYKGTWNASTNSPALASGVGTKGDYYVVSVAGSTTIDSENLWGVGDWIVFNGTTWQKVDGGDTGNFSSVAVTGGDITMNTAAKGVNFTANTPAAGMTSQLFSWYEEGTWTPAYKSSGGAFTTMTMDIVAARYQRIGRQVTVTCSIRTDNVNATGASGVVYIDGLPFTAAAGNLGTSAVSLSQVYNFVTNYPSAGYVQTGTTRIYLEYRTAANGALTELLVANLTTGAVADQNNITLTATYTV